jgi:Uma2 family endonuclease
LCFKNLIINNLRSFNCEFLIFNYLKMTAVANLRIAYPSAVQSRERRMSLERFRQNPPQDGWKYDWNNGTITKYKHMVSEKQRFIVQNLVDAFYEKGLNKLGGLLPETEMAYDSGRYRVPDVAFFTREQTRAAADGKHGVAEFVVEIISDSDGALLVESKLWEYFNEGVKVVWQILPPQKIVKVYTSPRKSVVCLDDDVCSAAPVLPAFELTVAQIFELK